jgi:hypothetical protein
MIKTRLERTEKPSLPATAAGKGLGDLPLGSPQSRAAARALVAARQGSEADAEWDGPLSMDGVAEALDEARKRHERGEVIATDWSDWTPIHIPPGKEDTPRGRLAADLNAARARMARYEAERRERGDETR